MQTCDTDTKTPVSFALLLMGPPKSLKTTTALQFPNVYHIDCDNNLSGPIKWLKANGKFKPFKYETIDKLAPDNPEQRWGKLIDEVKGAVKQPDIKFIVLDSLSSISQYLIDHIVHSKPKDRESGMTISDWNPYRNLLTKLITSIRSTGKILIMTAHEEINKDERLGTLLITPNMPSKLAYSIGGFFSDVWRPEVEEVGGKINFRMRFMPHPSVMGLGNSLGLPKDSSSMPGKPADGTLDFNDILKRLEIVV